MRVKKCGWCLYLGKARAYNVHELRLHFDTAVVSGYLIGGTLERWLAEAGETEILSRVEKIDYNGDVGEQLEYLFGVRPDRRTRLPDELLKKRTNGTAASSFRTGLVPYGSFPGGSYRSGSFSPAPSGPGAFAAALFAIGTNLNLKRAPTGKAPSA